jgi:hypothetical protein
MKRQYRIEGVVTTRWYNDRSDATDAYNRSRKCAGLPTIHCPGDVCGDAFCGGGGFGNADYVTGVRDGHAMVTLRMRNV